MTKAGVVLLVFLILGGFRTFLQAEEKFYSCQRLTTEPVLDGKVRDDIAWKNIPQETGFVKLGSDSLASKQTFFQMGFSHEALYIGVICEEPKMEKIVAEFGDMQYLWRDDSIEIFISPPGLDNYFQFIVNTIGSRWGWDGIGLRIPRIPLDDWQAKTYKGEDYYSLEIRIPFETFLAIPEKGEKWTGNIARNILTSEDRYTTWAYMDATFHEPDNFRKILIADKLSVEETKKTRKRIINILRKEIATNLELLKETADQVKACLVLKRETASFLKSYEELEKEFSQLDTVKKAHLFLRKSRNLIKEADELKGKILLQTLFD